MEKEIVEGIVKKRIEERISHTNNFFLSQIVFYYSYICEVFKVNILTALDKRPNLNKL